MNNGIALSTDEDVSVRGKNNSISAIHLGDIGLIRKAKAMGYIVIAVIDLVHVQRTVEVRVIERAGELRSRLCGSERRCDQVQQKGDENDGGESQKILHIQGSIGARYEVIRGAIQS